MFRKKPEAPPTVPVPTASATALDRITSVLSAGINWKGDLGGSGGVRIEGTFEGDIAMQGLLVVGETGRVTCQTMRANTVIVAGAVKGDITAERLEIRSTGKVWGNVVTGSFSTEEGAFLRGQITMEDKVDIGVIPEEEKAPEEKAPEEKAPEEKAPEEKTSEEKAPEETPAEKSWITIQSDTGAETQEVNKQITKS
jgi:cytoskeletal protein CcmA (bactofilin family)